jgi:mannobiose 2-epimerase
MEYLFPKKLFGGHKAFPNIRISIFLGGLVLAGSVLLSCKMFRSSITASDSEVASEMKSDLVDKILHIWYPAIMDTVHGGFYTNFSYDWKKMPDQEKMIVTQARDVWTACKAAEHFPEDKRYRKAADHGFAFLANTMWDRKEGGFFTYIGYRNISEWDCKHTYGNGFAMYALAAYYKLSHRPEALKLAQKTFYWLDSVAHDAKYGGYFNFLCKTDKNATPLQTDMTANLKDFNSSIHIMEALTELYKVWPDKQVRARLSEMLTLVRDTFTSPQGYLRLYFTADWKHISLRDSSEDKIRKMIDMDHVSFGHNIETAFLLLETSKTLGITDDTLTLRIAKRLVDHTLAHGFDKQYSGIFDGGYDFKGSDSTTILLKDKNWWSQAEGLNSLLLFSKLYPNQKIYKQAFCQLWDYVKKNLIDYEYGDWYISGLDSNPKAKMLPKASAWKCNYHTSRALMNCLDMLNGKDILGE